MNHTETVYKKDVNNKTLTVTRAFDAPLELVWKAWTESGLLDQWWAPRPYRAETKTMDFREGGFRLYCMVGPKGDRSWCKEDFITIDPHRKITNRDYFCDEEGNENKDLPAMNWKKEFTQTGSGTTVLIEISFSGVEDMEKIIKMGFQEGFAAGLANLDEYLQGTGSETN